MLTCVSGHLRGHSTAFRSGNLFKWVFLFLAPGAFFSSCARIPHLPASIACTFHLSNVFTACHNPSSSSNPISYTVALQVMYFNNSASQFQPYDKQTVNSASTPSSSISISAYIPKETIWYVDITLVGTQCSTCVPTTNNGNNCTVIPDGSSDYYGGIPQRTYKSSAQYTWPSAFSIPTWTVMSNKSCNCVVPNN